MTKLVLHKEYRQAPIGLIVFFGQALRSIARALWPILLAFLFRDREGSREDIFPMIFIGIAIIVLINAVLSFIFFRFQVTDEELRVRKGYLKRIKLSIPYDRIQSIQIKQNVIQQGLQLVTMEVETAGASQAEVKFIALKQEVADELKTFLQGKQQETNTDANELVEDLKEEGRSILQISSGELVKVGVSENHLRSFLIILSLFFGLYTQLQDIFADRMDDLAQMGIDAVSGLSTYTYLKLLLLVFAVSLMISFLRAYVRYYELQLSAMSKAFKLRFGLLNIQEYSIPYKKIQLVSWHSNPIRKLFDFQSVKIRQASSNEENRRSQSMEIPACKLLHEKEIEEIVFGTEEETYGPWHPTHWIYFVQRFFLWSLVGAALYAISYANDLPALYIFIIAELIILALCVLAWKKQKFSYGEHLIRIQKGSIPTHEYKMEIYKIQSIQLNQSLLMRWRKRATLTIYTAAGKHLTIPYISETLAREVYSFFLFKVENSKQRWM